MFLVAVLAMFAAVAGAQTLTIDGPGSIIYPIEARLTMSSNGCTSPYTLYTSDWFLITGPGLNVYDASSPIWDPMNLPTPSSTFIGIELRDPNVPAGSAYHYMGIGEVCFTQATLNHNFQNGPGMDGCEWNDNDLQNIYVPLF